MVASFFSRYRIIQGYMVLIYTYELYRPGRCKDDIGIYRDMQPPIIKNPM